MLIVRQMYGKIGVMKHYTMKERLEIRIPDKLKKALELRCKRLGVSTSEFLRDILEHYLWAK